MSPQLFESPPFKWEKENAYVPSLESVILLFDQENIGVPAFKTTLSFGWLTLRTQHHIRSKSKWLH